MTSASYLIDRGQRLACAVRDVVSAWNYDEERDEFPAHIYGEPYAIGDLGIDVERWLNEAELATRGFLTAKVSKMRLEEAFQKLRHPWFERWNGNPKRSEVLKQIEDGFATALAVLRALPSQSPLQLSSDPVVAIANTAFVLMWMDRQRPELEDVANAIKDVFREFNIDCVRADDIEHQDVITALILERIRTSEFLVADLSGERPNVYYEVGWAHCLGKRPILLRKAGTRIHFDLSVHNVPEYRNISELKELLRRRLEAVTGRIARGAQAHRLYSELG
jgi:hypothetical protein